MDNSRGVSLRALDKIMVWYPKIDQKVCLNMAKKDQMCSIVLKKSKAMWKILLKMGAMETNHSLLTYCFTTLTPRYTSSSFKKQDLTFK